MPPPRSLCGVYPPFLQLVIGPLTSMAFPYVLNFIGKHNWIISNPLASAWRQERMATLPNW